MKPTAFAPRVRAHSVYTHTDIIYGGFKGALDSTQNTRSILPALIRFISLPLQSANARGDNDHDDNREVQGAEFSHRFYKDSILYTYMCRERGEIFFIFYQSVIFWYAQK